MRCTEIDIAIIATSDTKLLETTVTGCPSKARAPVVNVTAKPVVTMGITTHRGSRKYAQSDTAISSTIAAPNVTVSERTKRIMSAATMGTPPRCTMALAPVASRASRIPLMVAARRAL